MAVPRLLGQPVPASGQVPHHGRHEVSRKVKERREGTRVKPLLNGNSLKLPGKGPVLRVETVIRTPGDGKASRPQEGDPEGPQDARRGGVGRRR